jgi:hypothetical protein
MLIPHLPLGLNGLELGLAVSFLAGLFLYLRHLGWAPREALTVTSLAMPVIVLTVAETTQFMTMDEWGISAEFMEPDKRGIHAMSYAWFFTGGALLELPIIRLMQLVAASEATTRMLLKAVWWSSGNIIVAAIVSELLPLSPVPTRMRSAAFGSAFAAIVLLPTVQLALKTVNYDLFSSGLGALAVLVFVRRLVTGKASLGRSALILAIFAAQEKLTAGPILIFIIVANALAAAFGLVGVKRRVLAALRSSVGGLVLAFLIPAASLAIYRLLGPPSVPDDFWMMVVSPLSSWAQIPLGLLYPLKGLMESRRWLLLGAAAPIGIILSTVMLVAGLPILRGLSARWIRIPGWMLTAATMVVVASIYLTGVFAVKNITAYWDPFHPASFSSAFMQRFSEVVLHTGATTLGQHYLQLVLHAFAVLVIAIPTGLWLFGMVGLVASRMSALSMSHLDRTLPLLLIFGSLAQPVASALAGMPFAHRYFNLSLLLLGSGLVLAGLPTLQSKPRQWIPGPAFALSLALVVGLVVEAAPFRPLFAAFRPFWLSYPDAERAELGRLNASWMGWGEEIMTGGKMLEKACRQRDAVVAGHPCQDITLYVMNSGLWLPGPTEIHLDMFVNKKDAPPLDDKSFYIVNRLYLIVDVYNIPKIEADFTVSYRGYALGWIFRGDRLKASGYTFGRAAFRTF